ncbi:metal-dependent hydrolase [Haloferax sp. YSMS24]|uniref:metal-dependent hydrolase n=1 Tax=Haloferax sp. YSMS24 TaxID=3388425 RepID=UPI00398CEB8E
MKSLEHAVVGAVVGVVAAVSLRPPGSLSVLVVGAAFLSVFIDLDHFVLARAERGDWANLRLAVTNPRVGLLEQEKVFEEFGSEFNLKRLFTHHLVGGVAVAGLALVGSVPLAAFVGVVLYVHVVCDFLRDLGIA